MDTHSHEERASFKSVVLRAIAIIGLVAILLLGAWGIIQIAFALPGFLHNLFSGKVTPLVETVESLNVTLPPAITSGQPFAVSWEHTNKDGEYGYQISYSCAAGLSLHAPTPSGSYQNVPCNTSFNFTGATETTQLTPTLSNKAQVPATITIFATKTAEGVVTAVGSTTTTVVPATAVPPPVTTIKKPTPAPTKITPTPKPVATYVAATRASTLYGSPDLAVSILGTQPTGSRYTMQFVVTNVGTNVSAAGWILTAQIPANPVYTYTSAPQPGMYPGDKIIYTLTFDAPVYGGYNYQNTCEYPYTHCNNYAQNNYGGYLQYNDRTVRITVDPQGYVAEYNRTNNTAATQI